MSKAFLAKLRNKPNEIFKYGFEPDVAESGYHFCCLCPKLDASVPGTKRRRWKMAPGWGYTNLMKHIESDHPTVDELIDAIKVLRGTEVSLFIVSAF